jgi:predicted Fe-Mo cluster-binding NifX family protein
MSYRQKPANKKQRLYDAEKIFALELYKFLRDYVMKIAISSSGRTLDSQVDQRFGRAEYFIIIETEGMEFEVLNNNIVASSGAGINTAKLLVDAGVEAVLTGNCGLNAQKTLSAAGIKLYTGVSGTVSDAIESVKAGKLSEAVQSNVNAHFGMGNSNG